MNAKKSFYLEAAPLFLILFIDGMGLGLVFPVLNALIVDPARSILAVTTSVNMRNLIFGLIVGIFMLCWFFGAAFLGDLSDQIGRKKSLMICLLGGFLGYVLSALGAAISSVSLITLGRIVAGFTSGSQSIAQAAIVDISTPETKARNIGFILLSICLGFIVGPLIGGVLSDNNLVSWFNFALPFCFSATISLLNALLLWFFFHETFDKTGKIKIKLYHAVEIFVSAFKDEQVKELSVIFLIMILGWSSFYSFISMFLMVRYDFSPLNIALFMALMGLGFSIGTGLLVDYFSSRFPLNKVVIVSLAISILMVIIVIFTRHPVYTWYSIAPLAMAIAVAYSILVTMFSNQVDENSQGWVMGITGSIMAFAFGFTGIIVAMLADFGVVIPIIISATCLIVSMLLMMFWYKGKK